MKIIEYAKEERQRLLEEVAKLDRIIASVDAPVISSEGSHNGNLTLWEAFQAGIIDGREKRVICLLMKKPASEALLIDAKRFLDVVPDSEILNVPNMGRHSLKHLRLVMRSVK